MLPNSNPYSLMSGFEKWHHIVSLSTTIPQQVILNTHTSYPQSYVRFILAFWCSGLEFGRSGLNPKIHNPWSTHVCRRFDADLLFPKWKQIRNVRSAGVEVVKKEWKSKRRKLNDENWKLKKIDGWMVHFNVMSYDAAWMTVSPLRPWLGNVLGQLDLSLSLEALKLNLVLR